MKRGEREGGREINSSRMTVMNLAVATVDIVKLEG